MPKQSEIRKKFPKAAIIRIRVSRHVLENMDNLQNHIFVVMRSYELATNYPYSSTPLMKNEDAVGVVHGFKLMDEEPVINQALVPMFWVQCQLSMTQLTYEAFADGFINFRYVSYDGVDERIIAFFIKETEKVKELEINDRAGFKMCMMGLAGRKYE